MRFGTVLVAAGRGARTGLSEPKQFLLLAGLPLLAYPLLTLESLPEAGPVVLVAPADGLEPARRIAARLALSKVAAVVAGGERRQQSVALGLAALPPGPDLVVVHDAARPFAPAELFVRTARAAAECGAAVAAWPVADTVKRVDAAGWVQATLDRSDLAAAQTPQAFRRTLLAEALARAERDGFEATDDAALVERLGAPVKVVAGSPEARKVTTAEDLAWADWQAARRSGRPAAGVRIGIGLDVHRLVAGRRLVLGGIELPFPLGLEGHSDADVLAHAICDALLGAAGLGDIGRLFPPGEERTRGISSLELLADVGARVRRAGWEPDHVDAVVAAEAPPLAPHAAVMQARLAAALGLTADRVHLKATTTEGLGFTGRGEGIAAQAVALLRPAGGPGGRP